MADLWSTKLARTLQSRQIASLVRYFTYLAEDRCAAFGLSELADMPELRSLIVAERTAGDIIKGGTRIPRNPKVTHLLYEGGDTHQLGELLVTLPSLQSLHVGRFIYSPSRNRPRRSIPVLCKLRQVTFQSVYHYDATLFDWMFESSKESIEHLTVANYGSLLNDLIPYFGQARRLDLTIKKNVFGVPEDPVQYQLSAILPRFPLLREVSPYILVSRALPS